MRNKSILIFVAMGSLAAVSYFYIANSRSGNSPLGDRVQWIDPSKIQRGLVRRESLSDEQVASIKTIHQIMFKYDGQTLDKWIDDFKRDMNPDREIEIWQAIGKAMLDVEKRPGHDEIKNRESYKIVLMSSMAPYEQAKEHIKVSWMEEKEIVSIYNLFSNYYKPTAQQGDAPEPASPAR